MYGAEQVTTVHSKTSLIIQNVLLFACTLLFTVKTLRLPLFSNYASSDLTCEGRSWIIL